MNVDDQLEHLLGNTDALLAAAMGGEEPVPALAPRDLRQDL